MNRADRKRRAFFDRGVAALRASYDIPNDWPEAIYACPLCSGVFTTEALNQRVLTLEDVPPKSVGGRPITLTCKACNNWSGATLDPSVKQSAEIATLLTAMAGEGTGSQAGSMTIAGQTFRGKLTASPGRLFFENDPHRHNPAAFAALDALLSRGIIPASFDYRATKPHSSWLAGVGTLRIAYLAAFAKFGYRYAFSPHLDVVRAQIQNPNKELVVGCWLNPAEGDDDEATHYIVVFPRPLACVLVRVGRHGVILPWWDGPSWSYPFPLGPGQVQLKGGFQLEWPSGMELIEDFQSAAPWRPTTQQDAPGAPG